MCLCMCPRLLAQGAIMSYGDLMFTTLTRARTAREAIQVMDFLCQKVTAGLGCRRGRRWVGPGAGCVCGGVCQREGGLWRLVLIHTPVMCGVCPCQYGYESSGESFGVGDPNEVWLMELIGKGKVSAVAQACPRRRERDSGAVPWLFVGGGVGVLVCPASPFVHLRSVAPPLCCPLAPYPVTSTVLAQCGSRPRSPRGT
jgi:hypothetical protein